MKDENILQAYVNNFRRHLAKYLKPNIGLGCNIYPIESEGTILEFTMNLGIPNDDKFMPIESSLNNALSKIKQHSFKGNLAAFRFKGTNIIMEHNRIILLKGDDEPNSWNDDAAKSDVTRVIPPAMRAKT